VYLTSFVHGESLFRIAERWLRGHLDPNDGRRVTEILICDNFVLGHTLDAVASQLLHMTHRRPIRMREIRYKGELRDAICANPWDRTPRVEELIGRYLENPDFFYREAPIQGVMCADDEDRLVGLYRLKRPRRIAEKANRYIANWIFEVVQSEALRRASERAQRLRIPVERLLTPEEEMFQEFVGSEEAMVRGFRDGTLHLDKSAVAIHDVGGIKVVADAEQLSQLEETLEGQLMLRVVGREKHQGDYRASSIILEVPWDREDICRNFKEGQCWERYRHRGIAQEELEHGLEPFLEDAAPTIHIEVILSTFPDMVESELGASIHEERILAQRDQRTYRGYIPTNVEFIVEYLLAVGFSPTTRVDHLPIKLWGRYLRDTVISRIRELYGISDYGDYV
jgi:hypothetical protein